METPHIVLDGQTITEKQFEHVVPQGFQTPYAQPLDKKSSIIPGGAGVEQ